ncbi:MAG: VanZ family protein [Bradyrhizobium sp.]|nr:VanZ family protein [Bradyrhizobium sp.]
MTMLLRLLAWCLAAAVTFATLGPPNYRPHANLGQNGDHALAFLLVGFAFGLAYRDKLRVTALAAVVTTGAVEVMQFWAPGRHARLSDFIVDALAICAGIAMAATIDWLLSRSRPQIS